MPHIPRIPDARLADKEDESGIPLQEFQDALDSFSDKAMDQVERRFTHATSNYLYAAGIPTTPARLLQFAHLIATSVLSTGIVDGAIKVRDSAKATDEEVEARKAAATAAPGMADLEEFLRRTQQNAQQPQAVGAGHFGTYL